MDLDLNPAGCGKRMMAMMERMAPFNGLINSVGLDRRIEMMEQELPGAVVHEYPAGQEIGSWIIPPQWRATTGFMKDAEGKTIASIEECSLFVAPYSEPVDAHFSKKEIEQHLRTASHQPDAFCLEHRNAYNFKLVDWAITLPFSRWQALPEEGKYHIKIEVATEEKPMKVLEFFLPGQRRDILNIAGHIDELCNDDLSGCVVGVELMRWLQQRPHRKYSYQMLLAPELIGTVAYVHSQSETVQRTFGMLNLETTGAGERWCLKQALNPDAYLYKTLVMAARNRKLDFKEIDFFTGYGNDERVYAWPAINIPGVALQKYPFKQYHTSNDVPGIISEDDMLEALQVSKQFIDILERDYVPKYTEFIPPWLSRYGLYHDAYLEKDSYHKFNNLVFYGVNGNTTVLELAHRHQIEFYVLEEYLDGFYRHGFIEKLAIEFGDNNEPA